LGALLDLPSSPKWLTQIHSNQVVDVSSLIAPVEADAGITGQTNIVCAVLTADCLPLLICSADGQRVAAVHAGWRGLQAGIISNTIAALATRDVLVWLGPAIGPECFEVGSDVYQAFVDKDPDGIQAFCPCDEGKWRADLYRLAHIELAKLGIERVYGGNWCTYGDTERFFSYRRDSRTGRMASLIWRT
jgi:YfiH family protein